MSHLKVGVVELVGDVPAEHQELLSFQQDRVEETEAEEQLLVLVWPVTPVKLLLCHQVVQTLQVGLQALGEKTNMSRVHMWRNMIHGYFTCEMAASCCANSLCSLNTHNI